MDLRNSQELEAYRDEVAARLDRALPDDWHGVGVWDRAEVEAFVGGWRRTLFENDLLAVHWPAELGGQGLTWAHNAIVVEELAKRGAPFGWPNDDLSIRLLGNTMLEWASPEVQRRFMPAIVSGEERWCQGFSEPGSGSDLASAACRARVDGDRWIISGQKTWTSAAHTANWIFVLARTEEGVEPQHRALSFLLCPLDQPGVTVRPIRTMTDEEEFAEVFFDDAVAELGHIVGRRGDGWKVAMSVLGWERGETAIAYPIRFRDELARLVRLARDRGRLDDQPVRDRLARCQVRVDALESLGLRMRSEFLKGAPPGPESSMFKLMWSEYHRSVSQLAMDVLGIDGLVPQGRRAASVVYPTDHVGATDGTAAWGDVFLNSFAQPIYAGTSQIQRTVIGERVLGLAPEPKA
jgi:alkylation response protein AidB-like acyl-CoA dehydrogenase